VIAFDAVDRDGHLLVVLVDGDGDLGLAALVANSISPVNATRRNACDFWPPGLAGNAALSVPGIYYARISILVQWAREAC